MITAWQWLMSFTPLFLWKLNPIKAHWGKGSRPFYFKRWAILVPKQIMSCRLILTPSDGGWGALWVERLPTLFIPFNQIIYFLSNNCYSKSHTVPFPGLNPFHHTVVNFIFSHTKPRLYPLLSLFLLHLTSQKCFSFLSQITFIFPSNKTLISFPSFINSG